MRLEVVGSLGARAQRWDELVDRCVLPSPFLYSWWLDATAVGRPGFVLVVEGDELLGGLAVQSESHLGIDVVRLMGDSVLQPDHLDIVAEPARRREVTAFVASWLTRRGQRVIDLRGLAEDTLLPAMLRSAPRIIAVAPFASLAPTWDAYLSARAGSTRSTITRTGRRLEREGARLVVAPPGDMDTALDALERLHGGRWGDASNFLERWPQVRRALRVGASVGAVRLYEVVDPAGEVVAVEADLRGGRRMCFYQAGRLTERRWRGLGTWLKARVIEAAIADGFVEYDLLRGDEAYKRAWSDEERRILALRLGVGVLGRWAVRAAAMRQRFDETLRRCRMRHRRGRDVASTSSYSKV